MILSLDVSSRNTGFAVFNGKTLVGFGVLNTYNYQEDKGLTQNRKITKYHNKIIRFLENVKSKVDIDKLVIEVSPIPNKTGRTLVLGSGVYIGAVLSVFPALKELKVVSPQQGQFRLLGAPGAKKNETWEKREDMKRLSILKARELFPDKIKDKELTDDMSDAILMGSVFEDLKNGFEIESTFQNYTKKEKNNG